MVFERLAHLPPLRTHEEWRNMPAYPHRQMKDGLPMLLKDELKACLRGEHPPHVPAWLFWMDGQFVERNRAEVRDLFAAFHAEEGRYMASPCNTIMPETPVENVWTLFEAIREYGRF
jgi:uroporphyrinogen-III decarboxylase